ncbi:unnamed protein product [Closterium sp. NIES-53]
MALLYSCLSLGPISPAHATRQGSTQGGSGGGGRRDCYPPLTLLTLFSASCVPPVLPPLQDLTRLRTQADTEAAKATMEEQEAAETANLSPTLISLLRAPALVPLPLSLQDLSRLRTQADMEAAKAAMEELEAAEITDLTRLRTQADTEAAKAAMEEQEAAETAARAQEAVLFSVHVVKPEPGTKADDTASPITSGYNTKRNEFDPEYDNEAEAPLAELEFKDSDSSVDRQLKIKMLHIYYSRCVGFG